jgi:GrpB-like predicted nucleotidyltransferase (UPF0157 family)
MAVNLFPPQSNNEAFAAMGPRPQVEQKEPMNKQRTRPLKKRTQMRLIAKGVASNQRARTLFLKLLRENPEAAKRMAASAARMRANFNDAFPGETRRTVYANSEWTKAGYPLIAELNDALGLKGS